jgi:shingomyelin synthase
LLHWASLCTTIAGVVLLLLARGHYSIDVLIAYWITTRVWWLYHTMVNNHNLKGDVDNPSNYLNRMWWWYVFRYFERNVPVNLPRRFGWPIPRRLRRWKPDVSCFRRSSPRPEASPTASTSAVVAASNADSKRTVP